MNEILLAISANPPPESLAWIVAGLSALVALALGVKKLFGRTPPIETDLKKLSDEFQVKLGEQKKELAEMVRANAQGLSEMANVNTQSHAKIYQEIERRQQVEREDREGSDKELQARVNRSMEMISSISTSVELNSKHTEGRLNRLEGEMHDRRSGEDRRGNRS